MADQLRPLITTGGRVLVRNHSGGADTGRCGIWAIPQPNCCSVTIRPMGRVPIVVSQSVMSDVPAWRLLALEVESLFGAPMADTDEWIARLRRHIDHGTAWCARLGSGPIVGGMLLSRSHPDAVTIGWLAVRSDHRRHGVGRALVEKAVAEAAGRPVRVVTFGEGHPMGPEAEASRMMSRRLGFKPAAEIPPDAPDGTPREVLWRSAPD